MKNYELKETFQVETAVALETLYGVIDHEPKVTLEITVGIDEESEYGFFELYDLESGGDRFYAEGGLWFEGKTLTEYDGVFELSSHIVDKLNEWGFDTTYI